MVALIASLLVCIIAYFGVWYLRGDPFDPHIPWLDWWWVCSFIIGALIGVGLCLVI